MFKNPIAAITNYFLEAQSSSTLQQMSLLGAGAIAELEEKLERHYGMKYALCVSSATMGLWAIAMALELGDSTFVTTPYTYGASLSGFLQVGCQPIFADIDHTLTLDPDSVRKAIAPNTKAILGVDLYGVPCDALTMRAIADRYGIFYIADAAQSFGASRNDLPASALADALVVSFTFGKSLFAGEGGAILTNNEDLYRKLLWWTQHPMRQRLELGLDLDNEFATNARIHPLAAIWANAVFAESLESVAEHQVECFELIDALNEIGLTEPIDFREWEIVPSFFRMSATWKDEPQDEALLKALGDRGFSVRLESPPVRLIYQQPAFLAQYGNKYQSISPHQLDQLEALIKRLFCLISHH
ncbi:DegT/DnrJ/EryC1/StrS family aminotransferase [Pseudanabaena sp. FACHB-1998]|uniref:DegT/DnrJ/EryC1/StrS family aminotransferase n=1 Tax=Pseudanabaena sp. FACHB-1998 TaxID=2692858 RepID=UPI0016809991|nr:DegT/DnrJ/EryC1/StrS family aminotransferase [Pseudanabaena sp. FACHB-1998]MBD2179281.1 DegT/DnrJ/EryC1/StrS family aminotransferase [Pseudanabaena sp. FACHB-1998]